MCDCVAAMMTSLVVREDSPEQDHRVMETQHEVERCTDDEGRVLFVVKE